MELTFEWDEVKAVANRRKHGVTFAVATRVFFDPAHIERIDPGEPNEDRFVIIGTVYGKELCVVYAMRGGSTRIISAREATRHEIFHYWQARQNRAQRR